MLRQSRRWSIAWSPEQIAHRLGIDYPEDPTIRISHEAIYQSRYIQGRGALRRELMACLHSGRALRVPRERMRGRGKSFVGDIIMISERPPEVEDRVVPGHREGDLILGLHSSAIGPSSNAVRDLRCCCTCRERTDISADKEPKTVRRLPVMEPKPSAWPSSPTCAAAGETPSVANVGSKRRDGPARKLRVASGLEIYFCDPQRPWQRGSNENTNGLLRQYFSKGADLSRHSIGDSKQLLTP